MDRSELLELLRSELSLAVEVDRGSFGSGARLIVRLALDGDTISEDSVDVSEILEG